jgi:hypothetical protein
MQNLEQSDFKNEEDYRAYLMASITKNLTTITKKIAEEMNNATNT